MGNMADLADTDHLYRAEFVQDCVARAEFWAENAIFMNFAGRQNMPIYEQNLSQPVRHYDKLLLQTYCTTM